MLDLLQWGRDFSAAEWNQPLNHSYPIHCFNGAATFQPRNEQKREEKPQDD